MNRKMVSTPQNPDTRRLTLSITPGILHQAKVTGPNGRMIRVRGLEEYSVSVEKPLRVWFRSTIQARNPRGQFLGADETLSLMIGDRYSIYARHQQDNISQKAFDRAWEALIRDPGNVAVEFEGSIERMMRSLVGPVKVLDISSL